MQQSLQEFGSMVFGEKEMEELLPRPVYLSWKKTIANDGMLDLTTANAIAAAMKQWAIAHGATHYTHWLQPLSGVTSEKHFSFIEPGDDGLPFIHLSGKTLIKGEEDASSFPTGGLRSTAAARGYTYWDVSSPAFIKENILCIPTILVSYYGDSLDTKAPLYKSMKALDQSATRMIHLLGEKSVSHVKPVCGLEQEYFLIDRAFYDRRPDIRFTGRTLIGGPAVKGMDLEDHYLAPVADRVKAFMDEADAELWRLGIYAQTEHLERAPAQYELAAIYNTCNVTDDQNMVMMDVLPKIAARHGLACLLHEKPFRYINGSGKHDNYSLRTDTGANLFTPGEKPAENIRFLIFICAFIKAVDDHSELLRLGGSCIGNDERLGASEAPPVVLSIFMGDYIQSVLDDLVASKNQGTVKDELLFDPGFISGLSYLPRDNTDRNRTSPIAFTGNRFEFRMLGSSVSAAQANMILNTILAKTLNSMCDRLEGINTVGDTRAAGLDLCREILREHKRILFGGNGYTKEWEQEAKERGLPNIRSYMETLDVLDKKSTVDLFDELGIMNEKEIIARRNVMAKQYCDIIEIEVKTLLKMVRTQLLKAMGEEIADYGHMIREAGDDVPACMKEHRREVASLMEKLARDTDSLESVFFSVTGDSHDPMVRGKRIRAEVVPMMDTVRASADRYERIADRSHYPYPTYDEMLYTI